MSGFWVCRDRAARAAVATSAPRRGARRRGRWGHSLIELIISLMVFGTLVSMGVPKFQQSIEQSRADLAGANLRAIWSAERLYWLQSRTFAPDLTTLVNTNLVDPSLESSNGSYSYSVTSTDSSSFTATATRSGSSSWSGMFTLASDGTFSGSVQQSGNSASITPGFQ